MSDPIPPRDVRAVMPDGREIPLECVYEGVVGGTHRWVATWSLPDMFASITAGMVPLHTSIAVAFTPRDEGSPAGPRPG